MCVCLFVCLCVCLFVCLFDVCVVVVVVVCFGCLLLLSLLRLLLSRALEHIIDTPCRNQFKSVLPDTLRTIVVIVVMFGQQ